MKDFLKLFTYIDATFTCRHCRKSCYQQHLSDYQVIWVSQLQTSKQKGPGVCYICLQSVLALTQGCHLSQLSLCSLLHSLHVLYTTGQPYAWLSWWAQHKHHVWGWMHTGRGSSYTPLGFFSWMLNVHPCCLWASILKNAAWVDTLTKTAVL